MTRETFDAFHLNPRRPPASQLADFIRDLAAAGELPGGEQLPPVREISSWCGIPAATVGRAVKQLVDQGILQSVPKSGVFVRNRSGELDRVAIYLAEDPSKGEMTFYNNLITRLQMLLRSRQVNCQLFFDLRSRDEESRPLPELVAAIRNQTVKMLIAPLVNYNVLAWLPNLGVPTVICGNAPCAVTRDFEPMFQTLLDYCDRNGLDTIGLICAERRGLDEYGYPRLTEQLIRMLPRYRRTLPPEWLFAPEEEIPNGALGRFGYYSMHEFLKQEQRPDALILYPDTMAKGAISAVMERGPAALGATRLLIHHNPGIDFFVPFPCTLFEMSSDPAELLLDALSCKVQNREPEVCGFRYAVREYIP